MKRIILALFTVFISASAFSADDKFIDCGQGFVLANAKARDGIPTVECKKLWCRDLENGKAMGSENKAGNGYETTSFPEELCDFNDNCIPCFGRRKWCAAEPAGIFDPELGVYVRTGASGNLYRGVLKGNCYAWQLQNHDCGPNEIAVNNGSSWVCLKQGASSDAARSAIKTKAIRRTAIGPVFKK